MNLRSVSQMVYELELCKEEHYFAEAHFLHRDCEIKMGNVFIQTNAISKQKKIALPDWCQMKVLLKGFQMT